MLEVKSKKTIIYARVFYYRLVMNDDSIIWLHRTKAVLEIESGHPHVVDATKLEKEYQETFKS